MKITDKNFLRQLRQKNPQAIEYIMAEYGGLIKTVLLANLADRKEHWEECFNDVLLALWHNGDRLDREKEAQFKGWLCAVAKYKAIDFLRREKNRFRLVSYEDSLAQGNFFDAGYEADFEAVEQEGDVERELEKLLSCLCEEDRDLFLRRYVREESIEEITQETGMKRETVYARISRGKKKLRRSLLENGVNINEKEI